MPFQLQTDKDIYADDTFTHTAGKKLKWLNPRNKSVQMTSMYGASKIIWAFIMVKHMHS